MTSAISGNHRAQRRLLSEAEPGQFERHSAEARALGLSWAAWTRAVQDESVSMQEVIVFGVRAVGTDQIRFVGRTVKRLEQRRREGFTGKLAEWCASCEWELVELERTSVVHSAEAEARWVAELGGDGMLFNPRSGGPGAPPGAVTMAVHLPRVTHSAAVELACAGHWSLGAFVVLAVEQLIEKMKRGHAVEVHALGTAALEPGVRWCSLCGEEQSRNSSGWCCSNGDHGGADSISPVDAAALRHSLTAADPGRRARAIAATRSEAHALVAPPRVRRDPNARVGSALNPRAAGGEVADDDDLDEASA